MDNNSYRYNNIIYVNKPIYLKGLGMTELIIISFGLVLIFVISLIVLKSFLFTSILFSLFLFCSIFYFKKVAKKNNLGDPDFLTSKSSYNRMKKIFVDNENILKQL